MMSQTLHASGLLLRSSPLNTHKRFKHVYTSIF